MSANVEAAAIAPTVARRSRSRSGAAIWLLPSLALACGWLLRDRRLINPEEGFGYWLGIAGATLMLLLLLYPLRKKVRALRWLGPVSRWFRVHMMFGVLGPVLILYHCNFRPGSLNSSVALFSMLSVALSGLVGRYLYGRIHLGLYGQRTSVAELQERLRRSREAQRGLARVLPETMVALNRAVDSALTFRPMPAGWLLNPLWLLLSSPWLRVHLAWRARRELRRQVARSPALQTQRRRLRRLARGYIRNHLALTARVGAFSLFERLFSLWHVFHLPLFLLLVITAVLHVVAVHMY